MVFSSFKSFRIGKHVKEYLLMYVSSYETKNALSVNVILRKPVCNSLRIFLISKTWLGNFISLEINDFSRKRSEHTDQNIKLKPTVLFRTTPTQLEIIITWCYRKPCYIVYSPCKVSNPTNFLSIYLLQIFVCERFCWGGSWFESSRRCEFKVTGHVELNQQLPAEYLLLPAFTFFNLLQEILYDHPVRRITATGQ